MLNKFNDQFNLLKEKCIDAIACLDHEIGFEKWSKAHFLGNRFNVMTTNTAYSLNAILLNKREYLVAAIINSIAHSFDEIFRKRYAEEVRLGEIVIVRLGEIVIRSCNGGRPIEA
ncbi:hypothetical protein T459_21479 [Capsicum annuum]|uniref:Uncharacterized protein n=1 Tax=Capsicum annuum TaxID=4072 RepID=A0A2G2YWS4_CAPAN|nr:hypothetical protein T459_21479 [Capsicum annuum]